MKNKFAYFLLIAMSILICLSFSACTETDNRITIQYLCAEGGYIEGKTTQIINKSENTETVRAVANDGYIFARWSDGSKEAIRTDYNMWQDLTVTAYFEQTSFTITYIAGEGGHIEGDVNQTVEKGGNATIVKAVADDGYIFVGWSDGSKEAIRTDYNMRQDLTVTANFEKSVYTINYEAGEGGRIEGNSVQNVKYNESTTDVLAIPNENYKFIGWDDGFQAPKRHDDNISKSAVYTAKFEKTGVIYTYVYNNATENTDDKTLTVFYDSLEKTSFPVPKRVNSVFEGWYLDKNFTIRVSDENGNLVIGNEIFDYDSDKLYAKFSLVNDATYKILMVYVTEVEGTFTTYYGESETISYKMSDLEIEICKKLTEQLTMTLNEIFAGLVNLEIDNYFTTKPVGSECFDRSTSFGYSTNTLNPYNIPELKIDEINYIMDGYRSVFVTVPLEMDRKGSAIDKSRTYRFHSTAAVTGTQDVCVFWESVIASLSYGFGFPEGFPLSSDEYPPPSEDYLDETQPEFQDVWDNIMGTYVHEFCHTVEFWLPEFSYGYDFHKIISIYLPGAYESKDGLSIAKLFLLNAVEIDGKKYGIPYEYWEQSISYNISFNATEGGTIQGNINQTVKIGDNCDVVKAVPDFGYEFVRWSTGETNPEMRWRHVYHDEIITAEFREITRAIVYYSIIDDKVIDVNTEIINYKDFLSHTLYLPSPDKYPGYEFEGWYLDPDLIFPGLDGHEPNPTVPVGDKFGKVSEADYEKIYTDDPKKMTIFLYAKFTKKE